MLLGPLVAVRSAMDPIGFFILAIILFNVVSTIVAGLKRASARSATKSAAQPDAAQAQPRLSPVLQSRPATGSQAAAARAAQIERVRRALLAAAGTPDQAAGAAQPTTYAVTRQPAGYAVAAKPATVATATPPARSMPQAPMPAMPTILSAPTFDVGTMQATPTLMTLESGTTAFDQLAAPRGGLGSAQARGGGATQPGPLDLLQGPDSGSNLFIAAAIVGPCAAFRPIGHTPGGW
jgi:hypothetical protein